MGGHLKLRKLWPLLMATASVVGVMQPRSLQAQTGATPPPLQQVIHSFDVEQPEATAYAIWNSGQETRHEVWFRVLGGEADYQQRLQVYKEQAPPRSPDTLPPESEKVYETSSNSGTGWVYLGTENTFFTYYFDGDNRPMGSSEWDNAQAVRVRKTVYSNGDLYEISFEDLNLLDDYDDLEIEVVLIRR